MCNKISQLCASYDFFFFFAHWTKTGYSWSVLNQVYKQVACYTECYMLLQMEKQSSHKGCKQAVVFFFINADGLKFNNNDIFYQIWEM